MPVWAWAEVLEAWRGQNASGVVQDLSRIAGGAKGGQMMNCARCKVPHAGMLPVCHEEEIEDRYGNIRFDYEVIDWICGACWNEIRAFVPSAVSAPAMAPKSTPEHAIRKSRGTGRKAR